MPASTDHPFTMHELELSLKTSTDTAPGADNITYSMLTHAGPSAREALLDLLNHSWKRGCLPSNWNHAIIHPIPKQHSPGSFRPISLLSCLSKTAERIILRRLQWCSPPPHSHLFAYTKGKGTPECLSSLLSELRDGKGLAVFIDLEKAFELACLEAILATLARRGVRGRLLCWLEDFFSNREAVVRFQGHLSTVYQHQHGTPQGSTLSPTLFNALMECLLETDLGPGVRLLCYADDLALVIHGGPYYTKAQKALSSTTDAPNSA